MKRNLIALSLLVAGLVGLWTTAVVTQSVQCGGSFVPSLNCTIGGRWNYTSTDSVSGLPTPFQASGVTATGVTSRTVTVSHANLLLIQTVPITLVPAPGAGKYVDVIGVQAYFDYTTAYTGGANLRLWYGTRFSGIAASEVITVSGFIVSVTADHTVRVLGTPSNSPDIPLNTVIALQGVGPNTQFAAGSASNVFRVTIHYRVVTV